MFHFFNKIVVCVVLLQTHQCVSPEEVAKPHYPAIPFEQHFSNRTIPNPIPNAHGYNVQRHYLPNVVFVVSIDLNV